RSNGTLMPEMRAPGRGVEGHRQRRACAIARVELASTQDAPADRIDVSRRQLVVPHFDPVLIRRPTLDREVGRPEGAAEQRPLSRAAGADTGNRANALEQPIQECSLTLRRVVRRARTKTLTVGGLHTLV